MLSDEKCKEILNNSHKNEISTNEIKLIRSLLYDWAKIEIEIEKENGL
jgi:hypothetical protein